MSTLTIILMTTALLCIILTTADILHSIKLIKSMRRLLDEQEDTNFCLQRENTCLERRVKNLLNELEKANCELAEYKRKWKKAAEFNTVLREDVNRLQQKSDKKQ